MDILIDREEDLDFSWSPGCFFNGTTYITGPISRRGPGVTDEDLKKSWICSGLPTALSFSITFKNGNVGVLYKEILHIICTLEHQDQLKISTRVPTVTKRQLGLKEEFRSKADEINEKNDKIREKILSLIEKLDQLGCNCQDLIFPDYNIIPAEWYNWEERTYASINICCHNKTELYKFLQEKGILDKYFPEWYRKGEF